MTENNNIIKLVLSIISTGGWSMNYRCQREEPANLLAIHSICSDSPPPGLLTLFLPMCRMGSTTAWDCRNILLSLLQALYHAFSNCVQVILVQLHWHHLNVCLTRPSRPCPTFVGVRRQHFILFLILMSFHC